MFRNHQFLLLVFLLLVSVGCKEEKKQPVAAGSPQGDKVTPATVEEPLDLTATIGDMELAAYELKADKILSAALTPQQLDEGWVRLFDGHTLAGWSIMGNADWRCKDGVIRVTRGDPSFLVSNFDIADYELKVDFRCAPETNSGVFLRTAPEPGDVGLDCLELNIAPPDNPYPTGSFVRTQEV